MNFPLPLFPAILTLTQCKRISGVPPNPEGERHITATTVGG